tara:strand:+ start:9387 stop:10283 length:897 start_codon:yes stop_codon:yes gene_type:complete
MEQYTRLCNRILKDGEWFEVGRNGAKALTVISDRFEYDCTDNKIEIPTTAFTKTDMAIAELLGYIRGETNSKRFEELGTPTWNANANKTTAWLNSPYRIGENHMGQVYGAVGNNWPKLRSEDGATAHIGVYQVEDEGIDLIEKIYNDLRNGIDDRGEIWTFWNPGMFQFGCLRPCLHSHHFSLLNGNLYLDSTQRSVDAPLGLKFNMVQVQVLLRLMAQITGHKAKSAAHNMVNCHIYENQVDIMRGQMEREDKPQTATLWINPEIKTLEDVRTWVTTDDFRIEGYDPHPFVKYPFTE